MHSGEYLGKMSHWKIPAAQEIVGHPWRYPAKAPHLLVEDAVQGGNCSEGKGNKGGGRGKKGGTKH